MVSYENLHKFYPEKLKANGMASEKAVGWNLPETQLSRFEAIYSYIKKDKNASIIDLGCGLGDLYSFLKSKGFQGQYLGIDLVPEMIDAARQKYPEAEFKIMDIMKNDLKADYIIGSGIMSVKISRENDQWQWVQKLIKRMFELSEKAAIFNFLDSKYINEDGMFYPFSVYQIVQYLVTISDIIDIKHDYLYYDFTLYLGKVGEEYRLENKIQKLKNKLEQNQ